LLYSITQPRKHLQLKKIYEVFIKKLKIHSSVIHIKVLKNTLFSIRSGISMFYHEHGKESQCGKYKGIREQCPVGNMLQ
jgi:hypothetical protein